jgi:hypothetical protein
VSSKALALRGASVDSRGGGGGGGESSAACEMELRVVNPLNATTQHGGMVAFADGRLGDGARATCAGRV